MSEQKEIEEAKEFFKKMGMDLKEIYEAKQAHIERMKMLGKQVITSRSKMKLHFREEEI